MTGFQLHLGHSFLCFFGRLLCHARSRLPPLGMEVLD